jgi:hypothetical protein
VVQLAPKSLKNVFKIKEISASPNHTEFPGAKSISRKNTEEFLENG